MKKHDASRSQTSEKKHSGGLSAKEMARFLKRLSSLYRDPKTGNVELSDALVELSLVLEQGGKLTLSEILAMKDSGPKPKGIRELGDLQNLSINIVRERLSDPEMTKADLIELGAGRFNIPRSGLMRMKIEEIVEKITSAIRHEESLSIISREAQRGGKERTS